MFTILLEVDSFFESVVSRSHDTPLSILQNYRLLNPQVISESDTKDKDQHKEETSEPIYTINFDQSVIRAKSHNDKLYVILFDQSVLVFTSELDANKSDEYLTTETYTSTNCMGA